MCDGQTDRRMDMLPPAKSSSSIAECDRKTESTQYNNNKATYLWANTPVQGWSKSANMQRPHSHRLTYASCFIVHTNSSECSTMQTVIDKSQSCHQKLKRYDQDIDIWVSKASYALASGRVHDQNLQKVCSIEPRPWSWDQKPGGSLIEQ